MKAVEGLKTCAEWQCKWEMEQNERHREKSSLHKVCHELVWFKTQGLVGAPRNSEPLRTRPSDTAMKSLTIPELIAVM